jgi:site-specific recombinase XerD
VTELAARPPALAAAGELVDPRALAYLAAEVAARQRAAGTRRTYASVYRGFCAWLGPDAGVEAVTAEAVRRYRDALERAGRSPATIAKQLSALRVLAAELGADAGVQLVKGARVARRDPRALTADEYARLLRMPDRRTRAGRRDLALLHLLGDAGLRRSELCALAYDDVDERRRGRDRRHRLAVEDSTAYVLRVRSGKRGRARMVPLSRAALAARSWSGATPGRRAQRTASSSRSPALRESRDRCPRATPRASSRATRRRRCRRTAARRTSCATPSAPCSPSAAPRSR